MEVAGIAPHPGGWRQVRQGQYRVGCTCTTAEVAADHEGQQRGVPEGECKVCMTAGVRRSRPGGRKEAREVRIS